jgi:DnaK suppressor protein
MDNRNLEYFRRILAKMMDDILRKGDEETSILRKTTADSPDFLDQAAMEADRSFRLRMRDREKRLMAKITEALERIDDGNYGVCEACGGEISLKRLKARPVATHCIRCKNKMEATERAMGT